ncbi:hypothetical protein D3C87_1844390 [compost metagenome]
MRDSTLSISAEAALRWASAPDEAPLRRAVTLFITSLSRSTALFSRPTTLFRMMTRCSR